MGVWGRRLRRGILLGLERGDEVVRLRERVIESIGVYAW